MDLEWPVVRRGEVCGWKDRRLCYASEFKRRNGRQQEDANEES